MSVARMTSIARQIECYEAQLEELTPQQQAFATAQSRVDYLNSLPVPEADQPASPQAVTKLDGDITLLQTAEEQAETARGIFQTNLEAHRQREADAGTFLEDARERRAQLEAEQQLAEQNKADVVEGQGGLDTADEQNNKVGSEGEKGKSQGESTQGTVEGTSLEPEPEPPEEEAPWWRLDKHAADLAKKAWRATVGRALAYIGERWNQLKQQMMQMLVEFALGLAGGDELKAEFQNARGKSDTNAADIDSATAANEGSSGSIEEAETTGAEAQQDAAEAAAAYADLVVEAEETKQTAAERRQEAEQWKADMEAYITAFEGAYGTSFEEAGKAQSENFAVQDPTPTIDAINEAMGPLEEEYATLEAGLADEAQGGGEAAPAGPMGPAPELEGPEAGPEGPEPVIEGPIEEAPAPAGPEDIELSPEEEALADELAAELAAETEGGAGDVEPSDAEPEPAADVDAAEPVEPEVADDGATDPETDAYLARADEVTGTVEAAIDDVRTEMGRHLDGWHQPLAAVVAGVDFGAVVDLARQAFDDAVGAARAGISAIRSANGAARSGDAAALAAMADVPAALAAILHAVETIARDITDQIAAAYDRVFRMAPATEEDAAPRATEDEPPPDDAADDDEEW